MEKPRKNIDTTVETNLRPLMPFCGVSVVSLVGLDRVLSFFDNKRYLTSSVFLVLSLSLLKMFFFAPFRQFEIRFLCGFELLGFFLVLER